MAYSLLFVFSSAFADVTATKEYDYKLNDGGRVSLSNVNGDIHIEGVSGNQVHIVAKKRADSQEYLDALEIDIQASDELIRIETHHPKSNGSWFHRESEQGGGSVSYELKVPFNSQLDTIETVNGMVEISAVRGAVSVETVNGKMSLTGLQGDANLDSVNGAVEAQFDLLEGGQRVKADTVNGRVMLRIPANSSAEVQAETLNGGIDADDFGLKPDKGFVGHDLNGTIGDGQARLHVDTVNGSVTLRRNN